MLKIKIRGLLKAAAAMTVAALMLSQAVFAAENYDSREDIPEQYKWDLTDIYAAAEDMEADIKLLTEKYIPGYEQFRGKLNNKEDVLAGLNHMAETIKLLNKLYCYALLGFYLDMSNSDAQELMSRIDVLIQKDSEASAFFFPELAQADEAVLQNYIDDPDFEVYINDLKTILADKAHTPSEEESELLAKLQVFSTAPKDIFTAFTTFDIPFYYVVDSEGEIHGDSSLLLADPDRELRKAGYENLMSPFMKWNNTMAEILSAEVNKNIFFAEAGKYDSAIESLLEHGIPVSVYDNLTETVSTELSGLHKYTALRKDALNLDAVYPYDMDALLTAEDTADYSFEEAKEMLIEALKPLGDEYIALLKKAFDENWVDVYQTRYRRMGACCVQDYSSHPFVLINYNGTPQSVAELAHEMGHAMNDYFSSTHQNFNNAYLDSFNGEVASTLNEMLLYNYLIDSAETKAEKFRYMTYLADLYVFSFYTQTMFAEFEQDIYETAEAGGALTAELLNKKWEDLTIKYYGESYSPTELEKSTWSGIPHFYIGFYVYQYATSMAAVNQIAAGILNGEPEALENYIEFISSGSKYDPIEMLSMLGLDMTSPAVIEECTKDFNNLVDEMEKLMETEGIID